MALLTKSLLNHHLFPSLLILSPFTNLLHNQSLVEICTYPEFSLLFNKRIDPSVHWFVWLLSFPVLIISPTKQRANSSADTESKELWPWAWQSPKLYQLLFIFCSLSVLNHCSSKYNSWLIELSKNSPLFFKTQFCYYYH